MKYKSIIQAAVVASMGGAVTMASSPSDAEAAGVTSSAISSASVYSWAKVYVPSLGANFMDASFSRSHKETPEKSTFKDQAFIETKPDENSYRELQYRSIIPAK